MVREVGPAFRARTAFFLAAVVFSVFAAVTMTIGVFYIGEPTYPLVGWIFSGSNDFVQKLAHRFWTMMVGFTFFCLAIGAIRVGLAFLGYRWPNRA